MWRPAWAAGYVRVSSTPIQFGPDRLRRTIAPEAMRAVFESATPHPVDGSLELRLIVVAERPVPADRVAERVAIAGQLEIQASQPRPSSHRRGRSSQCSPYATLLSYRMHANPPSPRNCGTCSTIACETPSDGDGPSRYRYVLSGETMNGGFETMRSNSLVDRLEQVAFA